MPARELDMLLKTWEFEANNTERLLKALPTTQYDFRPDPKGRSLGELAWHLAEIEAYMSQGVSTGKLDFEKKLPGLERPRAIPDLAPGYRRVHATALATVKGLKPEQLDRTMPFMGHPMRNGDVLWGAMLHHQIHHRGQLMLMTRLAGGTPPGIYGPSREEMEAMRNN